ANRRAERADVAAPEAPFEDVRKQGEQQQHRGDDGNLRPVDGDAGDDVVNDTHKPRDQATHEHGDGLEEHQGEAAEQRHDEDHREDDVLHVAQALPLEYTVLEAVQIQDGAGGADPSAPHAPEDQRQAHHDERRPEAGDQAAGGDAAHDALEHVGPREDVHGDGAAGCLRRREKEEEEQGQQAELDAAPRHHPGVPLALDLQPPLDLNDLDGVQTAGLEALPALDADRLVDDVNLFQLTADGIHRALFQADAAALTVLGDDFVDRVCRLE